MVVFTEAKKVSVRGGVVDTWAGEVCQIQGRASTRGSDVEDGVLEPARRRQDTREHLPRKVYVNSTI